MPELHAVVIVGSGPAGLAAALELRRQGQVDVLVLEREPEAGGMPRTCVHTGFGLHDFRRLHTGPGYARSYRRQVEKAGVEIRTSTTVTGWTGPLTLEVTGPGGPGQVGAQAILLATGCRERPRSARLIHGNRPQGVFTTGSLQRFVYEHDQRVGRRAVVVGAEPVSLSALLTLRHAHMHAVRMVTEQPVDQWPPLYLPARWALADLARVPIAHNTRVAQIIGRRRVEAVELLHITTGQWETVPCDTVVFTGDWIPEHELARLRGLELDQGTRGPRIDTSLRTSAPGIFAAGNLLRGAEAADAAALEGRQAGRNIAAFLAGGGWPARSLPFDTGGLASWLSPNAISSTAEPPPRGSFVFEATAFCSPAAVTVSQHGRLLYRRALAGLAPNRPYYLDAAWLPSLDLTGPSPRLAID